MLCLPNSESPIKIVYVSIILQFKCFPCIHSFSTDFSVSIKGNCDKRQSSVATYMAHKIFFLVCVPFDPTAFVCTTSSTVSLCKSINFFNTVLASSFMEPFDESINRDFFVPKNFFFVK